MRLTSNKTIENEIIEDTDWINFQGNGTSFIQNSFTFNEDTVFHIFARAYYLGVRLDRCNFKIYNNDMNNDSTTQLASYWEVLEEPNKVPGTTTTPTPGVIYRLTNNSVSPVLGAGYMRPKPGFEIPANRKVALVVNSDLVAANWYSYRIVVTRSSIEDIMRY